MKVLSTNITNVRSRLGTIPWRLLCFCYVVYLKFSPVPDRVGVTSPTVATCWPVDYWLLRQGTED